MANYELLYGLAEAQLGNEKQALAALERAAALDPDDAFIAEMLVKARAPRWDHLRTSWRLYGMPRRSKF